MSEANIRTQIYTILGNVANIGKVYDYERWAADWTTFINLFKTTIGAVDQIRGWEISRRGGPAEDIAYGVIEVPHHFLIRGFMGVSDADATEKTFNTLIESVRTAFLTKDTLNGTCRTIRYEGKAGIQVDLIESRMFGSVFCHYTELSLYLVERITY
jgi:hypothetical protein